MANREVTVDYLVPLTVRIDMETQTVKEVWLHLDSFQASPNGPLYYKSHHGYGGETPDEVTYFKDVFFSGDDWPDEIKDREIGPDQHPIADEALEIAGRVRIVPPEFMPNFVVDEKKT